jgi:hypothetical protein
MLDLLGKNYGNLPFPFFNTEKTVFDMVQFCIIGFILLVGN